MMKKRKKYKDMRTTCTRVTYNQMGEPQRVEVSLVGGGAIEDDYESSYHHPKDKKYITRSVRSGRRRRTGEGQILNAPTVDSSPSNSLDLLGEKEEGYRSRLILANSKDKSQLRTTMVTRTRIMSNAVNTGASNVSSKREAMKRTIHVLREILLGKIFRDALYFVSKGRQQQTIQPSSSSYYFHNSSSNSTALGHILHFFCQTSFGATAIANERETALFHAILEFQCMSSFLRVMKRLLCIPGIKSFEEGVAIFYFEVWRWLILNDKLSLIGLSSESVATKSGVKKNCNDHGSCGLLFRMEKVYLSIKTMLDCVSSVGKSNGNHFPPGLMCKLKQVVKSKAQLQQREIRNKKEKDDSNEEEEEVIVDDVLEEMLKIIEEHDCRVKKINNEIFSGGHFTVMSSSILEKEKGGTKHLIEGESSLLMQSPPSQKYHDKNKHSLALHITTISSSTRNKLKAFLEDFILLDNQRLGMLEHDPFVSRLITCYQAHCGMMFAGGKEVMEEVDILSQHFIVHGDDGQYFVDYVAFVGALYTFVMEEKDEIPPTCMFLKYLETYHGTDMQHLLSIQKYVENVRIKTKDNSESNMDNDREKILQLQRSMAKIRTYKESDFLAKWVIASIETENIFVRKQQQQEVNRPCCPPDTVTNNDKKSCFPKKTETKPPLHIIEPYFFDSSLNDYVAVKCHGDVTKNSICYNKSKTQCHLGQQIDCSEFYAEPTNIKYKIQQARNKENEFLLDCMKTKNIYKDLREADNYKYQKTEDKNSFRAVTDNIASPAVSNQSLSMVGDGLHKHSSSLSFLSAAQDGLHRHHNMDISPHNVNIHITTTNQNRQETKSCNRSSLGHQPSIRDNFHKSGIVTLNRKYLQEEDLTCKREDVTYSEMMPLTTDGASHKILCTNDPILVRAGQKCTKYNKYIMDEGDVIGTAPGSCQVPSLTCEKNPNHVCTTLQEKLASAYDEFLKPLVSDSVKDEHKGNSENFSLRYCHDHPEIPCPEIDSHDNLLHKKDLLGGHQTIKDTKYESTAGKNATALNYDKQLKHQLAPSPELLSASSLETRIEVNTENFCPIISDKFSYKYQKSHYDTHKNEYHLQPRSNNHHAIGCKKEDTSKAIRRDDLTIVNNNPYSENSKVGDVNINRTGHLNRMQSSFSIHQKKGEKGNDIEETSNCSGCAQQADKNELSEHVGEEKCKNDNFSSGSNKFHNVSGGADFLTNNKGRVFSAETTGQTFPIVGQHSIDNDGRRQRQEQLHSHSSFLSFAPIGQILSNQHRTISQVSDGMVQKIEMVQTRHDLYPTKASLLGSELLECWKHEDIQIGFLQSGLLTRNTQSSEHNSNQYQQKSVEICKFNHCKSTAEPSIVTKHNKLNVSMVYGKTSRLQISRLLSKHTTSSAEVLNKDHPKSSSIPVNEELRGSLETSNDPSNMCLDVHDKGLENCNCELISRIDHDLDEWNDFENAEGILVLNELLLEKDNSASIKTKDLVGVPYDSNAVRGYDTTILGEVNSNIIGLDENDRMMTTPFFIYLLGDELLLVGYDWQSIFLHTESEVLDIVSKVLSVKKESLVCFLDKYHAMEVVNGESKSSKRSDTFIGRYIYVDDDVRRPHHKLPRPAAFIGRLSREHERQFLSKKSSNTSNMGLIYYRLRLVVS
jgi:hypothetical protein